MPSYRDGKAALADARLRADGLGGSKGILLIEGRDDLLVFAKRVYSLQALITCGNKRKLKEAYDRTTPRDRAQMLFVTDCDYDVPAGHLTPGEGLILTERADREADLIDLGILRDIALRYVPRARTSDVAADQVANELLRKAVALAESIGQMRHVSALDGLGLSFAGINLRKFRNKQSGEVLRSNLCRAIVQRSDVTTVNAAELDTLAAKAPIGLEVCQGKDVIQAVMTVLHQDFNISLNELGPVPELFNVIDDRVFEAWKVVARLRSWESAKGVQLLG